MITYHVATKSKKGQNAVKLNAAMARIPIDGRKPSIGGNMYIVATAVIIPAAT